MTILLAQTFYRGLRPPYSYGPELLAQLRFTLKICFLPLILVAFALSFGPAGIQGSGFFGLFGAYDRMGTAWQLVVTRLFAPMTTAIVLAGAAGTAICADLGARVVREEIDALRVLGIDTTKSLVVPRVLVLAGCAVLFYAFALVAGMTGALAVLVEHHQPLGPFFATFFGSATLVELVGGTIKTALFGVMIAVVCCYKGLEASGGAEGVGRAVNQAVVVCFLGMAAIDYAFTQFLLATNPILSTPRG